MENQPTIKIKIGITKNLGDFENLRADVELFDIVGRVKDDEKVSEAIDRVFELAKVKLVQKVQDLLKEINE